jgi:hypothetical protein
MENRDPENSETENKLKSSEEESTDQEDESSGKEEEFENDGPAK